FIFSSPVHHRAPHSFPTRRSSDLVFQGLPQGVENRKIRSVARREPAAVFSAGKRRAKKGKCLGQGTLLCLAQRLTYCVRIASNHQVAGSAKRTSKAAA